MRFATPEALLLLIFAPLFLESVYRARFARLVPKFFRAAKPVSILLASRVDFSSVNPSSGLKFKRLLANILPALCFAFLVVSLSRPQTSTSYTEVETSGRDIFLVLDISGSMRALDFFLDGKRVSRLDALKFVVKEFIEQRSGDRLGIVIFGDNAFTQCPLTSDSNALRRFIDEIEIGMAGENTAIGEGIGVALKRLREISAKSKVIVLVTDGKNKVGTLTPREAAEASRDLKVKIHVVGIGGSGPAPIPVRTVFGTTELASIELEYDEKALKEIAQIAGGNYFNAKDTDGLAQVYREIDNLEEREEKSFEHIQYQEHYEIFATIGLIFFVLTLLFNTTLGFRIP